MHRGPRLAPIVVRLVALALLAWVTLSPSGADATPASLFVGAQADSVLDRGGAWTFEDMTAPSGADLFRKADGLRPANYGAGHGPDAALWLRLTLPQDLATEGGSIILTIRETRIRTVDLYLPGETGPDIRAWRLGVLPESARLHTRYPAIALPESARGQTIFIRMHTPSSMRASVWVQNEASYLRVYASEMMFFGLLFGALVALFIYLAAMAVWSRDSVSGILAVQTFLFTLHILCDQAFLETYIMPGAADLSRVISITATFGIYATSVLYTLKALQFEADFPRSSAVLLTVFAVLVVLTVAAAITTFTGITLLRRLSPWVGLSSICLVFGLALAKAFLDPRRVLIFLLCWIPALATGLARLSPDLFPQDGFNPILINLLYPAFTLSLLLAGISAAREIRRREVALGEAVAENATRLKAFADSASDSFWETDPAGRVTFASGPVCSTAGLQVGVRLHDVLAPDGVGQLRPGTSLTRVPLVRDIADRGQRHLHLSAVPIPEGGWRGIISDVTDEVLESERMNRQRRMAAIGQMAGGVAHEINNLLYPVINLSRRAGEGFRHDDERRAWLDIVQASGVRAAEIVSALLSSVRPMPGEGRREPLGQALTEIMDEVNALVPVATQIETRIDTTEGPLVPVTEVFQVVANLVTNALHATRGGAVRLRYGKADSDAPAFALRVIDEGIGMDEATLARALEPFFTTKTQGEGTGLGLSIVHGLVSSWGGDLQITSKPGAGTTVSIVVPLASRTTAFEGGMGESSRGG